MRYVLISASVLSATAAFAQEAPSTMPAFVPWQIDQAKAQLLKQTLGEVPAKYSMAIILYLDKQEEAAVLAEHAKAARTQLESTAKPSDAPPLPTPPSAAMTPPAGFPHLRREGAP